MSTTKMVYVADQTTPDTWTSRGYVGALKIADDRNPQVAEAPHAQHGPQYRHGWGVHSPGADHDAVFAVVAAEVARLGLTSYGLDLEFGWQYDTDRLGWQIQKSEMAKVVALAEGLFTAATKHLDVPLWVTCLANKYYPYVAWHTFGAEFISPQLYGATDVLPDPVGAWRNFQSWCTEQAPVPKRPKAAPPRIPDWAWQLRRWLEGGKVGARPALAPKLVPTWFAAWAGWRDEIAAREAFIRSGIPSLWKGQANPRSDGACIRFDAEIMSDQDYH